MPYVFSGAYTPLSCKLVEQVSSPNYLIAVMEYILQVLSKEGFAGLEDVMRQISNPYFAKHKAQSARGIV
jgi:hypothetical protein